MEWRISDENARQVYCVLEFWVMHIGTVCTEGDWCEETVRSRSEEDCSWDQSVIEYESWIHCEISRLLQEEWEYLYCDEVLFWRWFCFDYMIRRWHSCSNQEAGSNSFPHWAGIQVVSPNWSRSPLSSWEEGNSSWYQATEPVSGWSVSSWVGSWVEGRYQSGWFWHF